MNKIIIIFLASIIFLNNCGFKIVNLENNYRFVVINTEGNKEINYKLKNKLLSNSKQTSENKINLDINSTIEKSIKEKDVTNTVTKYEIKIISKIKYKSQDNRYNDTINIVKKATYNVSSKHSETLSREKKIKNNLIDEISEEIVINLSLKFNDN